MKKILFLSIISLLIVSLTGCVDKTDNDNPFNDNNVENNNVVDNQNNNQDNQNDNTNNNQDTTDPVDEEEEDPVVVDTREVTIKTMLDEYAAYTADHYNQKKIKVFNLRESYKAYKEMVSKDETFNSIKESKNCYIVMDKSEYLVKIYDNATDKIVRYYPCAYGRNPDGGPKTVEGDNRTPEGTFSFVWINHYHTYHYGKPDAIRYDDPRNPMGGVFMQVSYKNPGSSNYAGIALHGTSSPSSIGSKASSGCVRMYTEDAKELITYIKNGMKVVFQQ